jgi:hypothetical protein
MFHCYASLPEGISHYFRNNSTITLLNPYKIPLSNHISIRMSIPMKPPSEISEATLTELGADSLDIVESVSPGSSQNRYRQRPSKKRVGSP